jgi:hypothetical protein
MATIPSTTGNQSLIAWGADIATANVTISSVVDVSTKWGGAASIRLARRSGTAFTAGWPNVRIEASSQSSGNDHWCPLFSYQMAVGASIANTTLNGAVSAAATSCVVTVATNIAAGDILFLHHTTTPANYELIRVKAVSGTTVTFEEACTYAHDTGAAVTDQAEMTFPAFDLTPYLRVRAVLDNAGSGQSLVGEVLLVTFDSY